MCRPRANENLKFIKATMNVQRNKRAQTNIQRENEKEIGRENEKEIGRERTRTDKRKRELVIFTIQNKYLS